MKLLITGCCGFVGSRLLAALADLAKRNGEELELFGMDNLSRPGSEINRPQGARQNVRFFHGDLRLPSDLENLPPVDWVIDASANPSVLAGSDGRVSSRQLIEHNLLSTINLLEYCKRHQAGFVLLSTSRVYSVEALRKVKLEQVGNAFQLAEEPGIEGVTQQGVNEDFCTTPPLSLYGTTKLTSELLALEYSATFGFPTWIDRCGVMAGAGQFGRPDQGIIAFWIHSWFERCALRYIGFGGKGSQVRDCLHPVDLAEFVRLQITGNANPATRIFNVSGGMDSQFSLAELSAWCERRFGPLPIAEQPETRAFDVPWLVLDSSRAKSVWNWAPRITREAIFAEIAQHAIAHPNWISLSQP